MPLRFSQTLQALEADRRPRIGRVTVLLTWVLISAWLAWFFFAEVTLRETTTVARLEVRHSPLPLQAPVDGEVIEAYLELDREVSEGEVLLRLDAKSLELDRLQAKARADAAEEQIKAMRFERQLATESKRATGTKNKTRSEEASAELEQASIEAETAKADAERAVRLHRGGQISRVEMEHLLAAAESLAAARESARLAVTRIEAETQTEALELETELARLGRELARLDGELHTARAEEARLRHEISRRTLRSPTAGRLAEATRLRTASTVQAGDRIATLLPDAELEIVAELEPESALGRLQRGQQATVQLAGYPWTQYGSLSAEIERVAKESRYGLLRVELSITDSSAYQGPLTHGLVATVSIEVERLAPSALALRAAGRLLEPAH